MTLSRLKDEIVGFVMLSKLKIIYNLHICRFVKIHNVFLSLGNRQVIACDIFEAFFLCLVQTVIPINQFFFPIAQLNQNQWL